MKFRAIALIALASVCGSSAVADKIAQPMGAFADTTYAPGPAEPVVNADCDGNVEYCPSADQIRVDRSFSDIAIDTSPQSNAALNEERVDGCEQADECAWLDDNKVRHYFWSDGPANRYIVVKLIKASDFNGRPIPTLGIGDARKQADVLANVRRFLPDIEIECGQPSGNVGPVECGGTLNPGWFQIGFDQEGNLLAVRFDGYEFT